MAAAVSGYVLIAQDRCVLSVSGAFIVKHLAPILCLIASIAVTGCSNGTAAGTTGGGGRGRGRGGEGGAVPVVTAKVTQRDVPVEIAAIGNVEAYTTISVRSQITGQLQQAFFREGDTVKKGSELFSIDPRPFQAALQQAQANLIRDQALLNQSEAQLSRDAANAEYSQVTAERQESLVGRGIISKDVGQQARSAAEANAAMVKADKAAIESARAQVSAQQAMVDNAKLQLEYTNITSPIDGRTGNIAVKVGNLVTANQTELMTIAQVQPVYVTFSVPAAHLPTIKQHMATEKLKVIAVPQDASAQPADGVLAFVDNTVDVSTDTIKLKATFANADTRLWPGQFARVTLRLATLPNAIVAPNQAVQTGQDGQFIFVVKPDSTVDQRPVVVGQRVNDDVVIDKGLQPGETIVTEGQLRLEAGTRVQNQTDRGNGPGRGGRGRGQGQGQGQRSGGANGSGGAGGAGAPGGSGRTGG
jgi:multidrug efflux system membrane fusion protein